VISVGGFFILYLLCFLLLSVVLAASGVPAATAISAIAACLNNLGAGIGEIAVHFETLSDFATWVCSFTMILGRLEVFTILVLLTPQFWNE
jgi:trk system potassium uptake protein TrkH